MKKQTRILIADDHPMFREGLVRALRHSGDFQIVAKAGDGDEALRLAREISPDMTVLDVSMPKMDGLQVAQKIQNEALPTAVIILTMYKDLRYFNAALDAGARGYILKDTAPEEFLRCLETVNRGERYISPAISHLVLEREKRQNQLLHAVPALERLTPAERSILKLIAQNLTNREIAEKRFVSVRTVESHRMNISQKLGIKGSHKLLKFALDNEAAL